MAFSEYYGYTLSRLKDTFGIREDTTLILNEKNYHISNVAAIINRIAHVVKQFTPQVNP